MCYTEMKLKRVHVRIAAATTTINHLLFLKVGFGISNGVCDGVFVSYLQTKLTFGTYGKCRVLFGYCGNDGESVGICFFSFLTKCGFCFFLLPYLSFTNEVLSWWQGRGNPRGRSRVRA